jgi:NAD(P)-dependent dehydrogenase (short-subunit alcohol dehydrogenase family)
MKSAELLTGKVVFLTGGAQGIGRECALAYQREGAQVVVADIVPDAGVRCDVGDARSVEEAIAQTLREYGRIDALHNNAGIASPSKPLHDTTEREWDELQRVNLKSVYLTTRYAFDALKASKGSILNTASMVGLLGQTNHAAYVATKGGMIALTKAMAVDYAPLGIRVNAVCPAGVWTPMLRQWAKEQPDPGGIQTYLDEIHALGYCPEGDVVADACVFLLSDKARFITGCILPVSGGAELGYRKV